VVPALLSGELPQVCGDSRSIAGVRQPSLPKCDRDAVLNRKISQGQQRPSTDGYHRKDDREKNEPTD
jgi:hypothetical protein